MSRIARGAVCAALLIILCLTLGLGAAAVDFPDAAGHWAEADLRFAAERGWITGFEDGTVRPDEKMTGAQAVTLITRILGAEGQAQDGPWYAAAADGAKALGIISGGEELDAPLSRGEAFLMLAVAFQTYSADEDKTIFNTYTDAAGLPAMEADPLAGLINRGIVRGYNGSLGLDSTITRAEFAALLTRLISGNAVDMDGKAENWQGDMLWIGCPADQVQLSNVEADTLVIRSREIKSLKLENCRIENLVLAHGGSVTVKDDFQSIRLASNGASATVGGKVGSLAITGEGSTLSLNGSAEKITVYGNGTSLRGRGKFGETTLRARDCSITSRAKKLTDLTDNGITGASAKLEHPDAVLPAGETLTVTAKLKKAPEGLECAANWYVDGRLVQSENVALQGKDEFTLNHEYFYRRDMNTDTLVRFELSYTTSYGETQTVSAEYVQTIENYPDDWVFPMDPERVLALVTTEYLGDYTLEWAEAHDYEDFEKEIWVNAKGFESSSQYLIWINQSYSRVNIFEGSQGQWKLIRSNIVGCGADATPTPRGVFKTTWNQPIWNFGTYDVYPIVRFKGGGYAFHSRLYYPGTEELMDASIGFPSSHGCIRMYLEDIRWIYDNVPSGTTVVSF